jgi:hypothetical protein
MLVRGGVHGIEERSNRRAAVLVRSLPRRAMMLRRSSTALAAALTTVVCSCSFVETTPLSGRAAGSPPPALVVETIEGAEAARANATFASARAALGECRPGTGGVLRLRLSAADGKVHYAVEPGTAIGPQTRRCVLEALSTVDVERVSGDASPSARALGFTALIRVEW